MLVAVVCRSSTYLCKRVPERSLMNDPEDVVCGGMNLVCGAGAFFLVPATQRRAAGVRQPGVRRWTWLRDVNSGRFARTGRLGQRYLLRWRVCRIARHFTLLAASSFCVSFFTSSAHLISTLACRGRQNERNVA